MLPHSAPEIHEGVYKPPHSRVLCLPHYEARLREAGFPHHGNVQQALISGLYSLVLEVPAVVSIGHFVACVLGQWLLGLQLDSLDSEI